MSLVGKFVNLDESTWKKTRLDVGRVIATLSCPEAINRTGQVKINNKIFSIRIVEDVFRFSAYRLSTDCVLPVAEGSSSSEDSESMVNSSQANSATAALVSMVWRVRGPTRLLV